MVLLQYEDAPRWFTLSIDQKSGFPCLVIINEALKNLKTIKKQMLANIIKNFDLDSEQFPFQSEPAETFGFGNSLERIAVSEKTTTYRMNLPKIHALTDKVCQECGGTKEKDSYCPHCFGAGFESEITWKSAFALSWSTSLLLNLLSIWEYENKTPIASDEKQLLTLDMCVSIGMHGGSIGGSFSPHFIETLKRNGEDFIYKVPTERMHWAYHYMWQRGSVDEDFDYDKRGTRVWQNLPGNLLLDVPGDACGVHPSPHVHEIPFGKGVEFACHNVDSPLQQLALITGLAAVCDLVG